ncbi:piggyBac transposable element-derived protein 3-like [Gordionus sp. m RMFG-2023]|uniref:piggyBac transposable element-derived protein 3-like n=1 Tax=Gordionus sp. m RMFG-2023 TaxID=3053472 RepID=UPI0031FC91A8
MDDYLDIPSEGSSLDNSSTDSEDDYESDTRYQIDSDDYESDTPYQIEIDDNSEQDAYDQSATNHNNPIWSKKYSSQPALEFDKISGPISSLKTDPLYPSDIYKKFINDSLINTITFNTNLYAQQKNIKYQPTNPTEIRKFLCLHILFGIKTMANYKDYWSSKPEFHDNFVSSIMKVKRFIWLMAHIHINDNILEPSRNDENYDKLYKIRPFIDNIRSSCLKYFLPSEYQAIDEGMIRFKGRIGFRQYMPKKPTKRGFKVWMRCDNSGYMNDFNIYVGKNKEVESNLGYNVVTKFCEGLQNHKIFFDNYFTSYTLMADLKKKGIYASGTLNKNRRYLPIKNMETKLKRGEFDWRSDKNNISIIKWRDNRDVFIMSNYIDPRSVDTVKRKNKKGEVFDVKCPIMIKMYNKYMGSVDHFDHLKSLYEISRKWRKWWLPIFFWLIDAAIINSFIIYNILTDNKLSSKEFRRQIIASELAYCKNVNRDDNIHNDNNYISMQRKNNKPYILPEIRLKNSAHQPQAGTSRRCTFCSTKLNPRRTRWSCKSCNVPLCLNKNRNCFESFHKVSMI